MPLRAVPVFGAMLKATVPLPLPLAPLATVIHAGLLDVAVQLQLAPAVTVTELDAYGNVATQDSATQVALVLGTNPGAATLTGGGPVTVSHGVATFTGRPVRRGPGPPARRWRRGGSCR